MFIYPGFCQILIQGHILVIPDLESPTSLFPLLIPSTISDPYDAQER